MNIIEGLKACCAPEGRYNEPFRFEMNGSTWVGATNGWGMAVVQTNDDEALAAATGHTPGGDNGVATALGPDVDGEPVSLPALREWCAEKPHRVPCEHCKGTRRLTCSECKGTGRIEHECDCGHCHIDDDGPCDECGGEKEYDCEECTDGTQEAVVLGAIGGIVVNRVLLAKVLASAPPSDVLMLRVAEGSVHLSAPWWRAAVMAYRHPHEGLSVFCCPAADDSPRDKIVNPRMGDWFFDAHGWVRRVDSAQPGRVAYVAWGSLGEGKAEHGVSDDWARLSELYGLRPMTPGEVEVFERNGARPECPEGP